MTKADKDRTAVLMLFHLISSTTVRRSLTLTMALFSTDSMTMSCPFKSAFASFFRLSNSICISCFNVPMSSFIFMSSRSTSLLNAAVAARIAAESLFVLMLTSALSSDNAALNRYACCTDEHRRISLLELRMCYGTASLVRTLSRSFFVRPSFRTRSSFSTNKLFVTCMSPSATGVGNVVSNLVKNA